MGSQIKKVDGTFSPPTLHITTESSKEKQEEVDTPVIIKSIKEELQKFQRPKSPNIERLAPGKSIYSFLMKNFFESKNYSIFFSRGQPFRVSIFGEDQ